jgi:hypothetical protein
MQKNSHKSCKQWAEQEFEIQGGAVTMRFGDMNYSAGIVAHIYSQLVVLDLENTDLTPVRIKIRKTKQLLS